MQQHPVQVFPLYKWLRIAIINLLIVATLGVAMRYKIIYPLPWFDQKHLLHAHSHFGFYGWISQALYTLLVSYVARRTDYNTVRKYNKLLVLNLVAAYGMLLSFPFQGYGPVSISFSLLSVLVSYWFTIQYWSDLKKVQTSVTHHWFKWGLLFNIISSLGTFALAYMMANQIANQHGYLASIYFFLHFQYNGWFFFIAMGLFSNKLFENGVSNARLRRVFRCFVWACVPAYLLSVLWLNIPMWVYVIVVASAIIQVVGWARMLVIIKEHIPLFKKRLSPLSRWLLGLSGIALSIKLILQLGSVIPSLSKLSYAYRPIIIGYLHLMLLGVITLFIFGYIMAYRIVIPKKKAWFGLILFVVGVLLNELILLVQGVTYMNYLPIPYLNEGLLGAAVIMLSGLMMTAFLMREPLEGEQIMWRSRVGEGE